MKTHLIIIGLIVLFVVGCTPDYAEKAAQGVLQDKAEDAVRGAAMHAKDAAKEKYDEETQDLVNFKCIMPDQRVYYFLNESGKVESPVTTTWLIDDKAYGITDVGGKKYLLVTPIEDFGVTYDAMKVAYRSSKNIDGMDCELDVVTKEDMQLPDLEQITNDELADKMLEGMGQVGLS